MRARPLLTIAGLLLLPLFFLWRPLLLGETFYYQDLAAQYFPREALLERTGLTGWDPHLFLGVGLAGEPQSAAYEPVRALGRAAHVSEIHGLVLFLAFYLTLATLGMYCFARRKGASPSGAALAVLACVWGGIYLVRFRHPWCFGALCLLPWVAWFVDRLLEKRRLLDGLMLGIVIAWGALSGHPQPPYLEWLFVAGYLGAGIGLTVPRGRRLRALFDVAWRAATGVAVFAGLLFAYYAPVVELLRHSARGGGAGIGFAGSYSWNPWDWARLIGPDLYGNDMAGTHYGTRNYHEQTCYLGLAPLFLVVAAVIWRRRSHPERLLLFVAAGAFLLAGGRFLPPFYLAYWLVPGFRLFRGACRYMWIFVPLAGAVAGILWTRIAAGEQPPDPARLKTWLRRLWIPLAALCTLIAMGSLAWSGFDRWTEPGAHRTTAWAALRAAVLLVLVGTTFDAWLSGRWKGRRTAGALLALTLLDLGLQWLPYRQSEAPDQAFPSPAVVQALVEVGTSRVWIHAFNQEGEAEIVPLLNWGEAAGYDDVRGYNQAVSPEVLNLLEQGDLKKRALERPSALGGVDPADWLLDLTGVKRIAARAGEWPERWRGLPLVATGGGWEVRERSGPLPRAWLVRKTEVRVGRAALERLPSLDLRQVATVEEALDLGHETSDPAAPPDRVRFLERAADDVEIDVEVGRSPALLVLADRYDPHWSATVDGIAQPMVVTDYLFRGVRVSTGAHRVHFHYAIAGQKIGARITRWTAALVLLLLLGLLVRALRQRRQ